MTAACPVETPRVLPVKNVFNEPGPHPDAGYHAVYSTRMTCHEVYRCCCCGVLVLVNNLLLFVSRKPTWSIHETSSISYNHVTPEVAQCIRTGIYRRKTKNIPGIYCTTAAVQTTNGTDTQIPPSRVGKKSGRSRKEKGTYIYMYMYTNCITRPYGSIINMQKKERGPNLLTRRKLSWLCGAYPL